MANPNIPASVVSTLDFKVGSWYKSPKWKNFYIKVDEYIPGKIITSRRITENVYKEEFQNYTSSLETYVEVPISEIAHMLPDYEKRELIITDYQIF